MKNKEIIKAWKEPGYRETLGDSADLPEHPAGWSELRDTELGGVVGGLEMEAFSTESLLTLGCCSGGPICDEMNTNRVFTWGCCTRTK